MPKVKGALLDTNACLYLLKKQVDPEFEIEDGIVSVISEVELLGYSDVTKADEKLIRAFLARFELAQVDEAVRAAAIRLRRKDNLRLGDALIAGTALARKRALISHDNDFQRISEIQVLQLPLIP